MTAIDIDYQCKRCGSSLDVQPCEGCDGSGFSHHECGEDCCSCADPHDNVPCDWCGGQGSFGRCLSSEAWCVANPLEGREQVERHTPEEFVIP